MANIVRTYPIRECHSLYGRNVKGCQERENQDGDTDRRDIPSDLVLLSTESRRFEPAGAAGIELALKTLSASTKKRDDLRYICRRGLRGDNSSCHSREAYIPMGTTANKAGQDCAKMR